MNTRDDAPRTLSRRRCLAVIAGGIAGFGSRYIHGTSIHRPPTAMARDVCYWEDRGGPYCSGGRKYQKRCEVCCAGGVCETVQCILVDLGRC
jgi:hypothetical protein